ncbi:MFS transporter [Saccharothrix coeruleofusca]|uniref:MFS transporter n=1 Tax=Saccharothrix coeruleofusca TaxID=33919 RepID=UPI00166FB68B|nr:MFS transporter [Saccharothrix coeruleofusca]MBP2340913.1 YNFM family putative membrane transporter [Saccharothrix coeruleofusca]
MPTRLTTSIAATGFATFALLYAPQPVLPQLAAEYDLSPGSASLAVSAATGALAVVVVPVASLSGRIGRRRVIVWSVLAAAVLGLLLPLAPSYPLFLALRVLQGVATAGVPAVAMAFLAEQVGALGVGAAIGALVAGNSAGGMVGRLVAGVGADWLDWRGALALVGAFGLVCAVLAALFLPAGRRRAQTPRPGLRAALGDRVLWCQYAIAALAVAAFVSLFNVVSFRLAGPPLELPARFAALVFLAYAAGGVCSAVAGRLADRLGRGPVVLASLGVAVLGALATLPDALAAVCAGLALFTGGFFAAHAVAGGWVGARAPAHARGQASGVYLFAFYVGSSAGGTAGSAAYGAWGWPGLVAVVTGWLALAGAAAVLAQKSSGTATGEPSPATGTVPSCGSATVAPVTPTVTERVSAGTSTTTATGKVSPS